MTPGELMRSQLNQKGWTQEELAYIMGRSRKTVMDLMAGRTGITPETAVALGKAFGNDPGEWMRLQTEYQLSLAKETIPDGIERRAKLYDLAPISDMQRRGWISETRDPEELEHQLKCFFGKENLEEPIELVPTALRGKHFTELNNSERAWCFRARQLAASLVVSPFSPRKLDELEKKLRLLAAYPKEISRLPKLLSEYGIRFAVIEPIPGVKIDGATFWIDDKSPVIAITLRCDRIDGFWFTLMHEIGHIRNGDALAVDRDLIDVLKGLNVVLEADENEAERHANEYAGKSLISSHEMESFIGRVGPLYSREKVIQFAHRVKIHPGIIVGQLQYRREIGYASLREMLVKVRHITISTALTDGWNQTVTPTIGGERVTATNR